MPRSKVAGPTKRQAEKFAALMASMGIATEADSKAALDVPLMNIEQMVYEAQAVINYFESRIKPELDRKPGEPQAVFESRQDAAYKVWAFRDCKGCGDKFAYAYSYDGVQYCSLDCLEADLQKIGIKFSRHKDLKRRWGRYYPAVVSSNALALLEGLAQTEQESSSD
jgi:hypothetical protein